MRNKVSAIILNTARRNLLLALAILVTAAGAIGAALVPPLVLGRIVDALVNGQGWAGPPAMCRRLFTISAPSTP